MKSRIRQQFGSSLAERNHHGRHRAFAAPPCPEYFLGAITGGGLNTTATSTQRQVNISGGRGIRTPATLAGRPVFKTGAFSRSAIPPETVIRAILATILNLCNRALQCRLQFRSVIKWQRLRVRRTSTLRHLTSFRRHLFQAACSRPSQPWRKSAVEPAKG